MSYCLVAELVVAKLSTKIGHSGGIASTGRVQVGDVVTAISMTNEEMQYLAVGPQKIQREHASHVYSMLKKARGHIRLQVERYKEEVNKLFTSAKKQYREIEMAFTFVAVVDKQTPVVATK
ncbi:unnamed protein product [Ilex paraguariensis]|uniref:Uncharacterized protein n=1 Tax=Ilex paraguariensis TaxID=185542 RepID=A0ABC8UJU1_9AQUA